MSNFSFSHSFVKRLVLRTHKKKRSLFRKGLTSTSNRENENWRERERERETDRQRQRLRKCVCVKEKGNTIDLSCIYFDKAREVTDARICSSSYSSSLPSVFNTGGRNGVTRYRKNA